jgi:hypothetical protein
VRKGFPENAALGIGLLFLCSMLRATGGRLSLPVDDSFIYFQYARQAVSGELFVYQSGDAPTTGVTSIPWVAILAGGVCLGFDEKSIVVFAFFVGAALLSLTARFAGKAERVLAKEATPARKDAFATLLVLLSGPLLWGAFSGMEIALFAAGVAWAFWEWCEAEGRLERRPAIALAFLATIRPEGALLALVALLLGGIGAILGREARRSLGWGALPILASVVQPLVNFAATGDFRSTGFLAKALFAAPGADLLDVLRTALLRAASLAGALLGPLAPLADGGGLYAYESEAASLFVAPGSLFLFALGALPALAHEVRERRPGGGTLALAWLAAIFVATSTLEEPDAHFSRYQMPILPVFLSFVAVGWRRVAAACEGRPPPLALLGEGARLWLLGFGAVSACFFCLAYGDNCEDIDRMQIRFGESLRETLEPEAVLAVNDAGAIAYFSGRKTLDLIGLTTPGFAGLWSEGSGALWEKLESLPPAARPSWFCYFPNWFELDQLGVIRRKGSIRLLTPSIVDAEKVLARADWALAGSGDTPRLAPGEQGFRVLDRLDLADIDSERAHAFAVRDGSHGGSGGTFVRRAGFAGNEGSEVIDAGRTVLESMRFEIGRSAMEPALLVVRSLTGARARVLVSIDGAAEREIEIYSPGAGLFHDQIVSELPPGGARAKVALRVVPEPAASAPLLFAHVFSIESP